MLKKLGLLNFAEPSSLTYRDPLLTAAAAGDIQLIQALISQGHSVDPCFPFFAEGIALHVAIQNNQIEAAKFLLSHGADVNSQRFNETAVGLAAQYTNLDFVKFLINSGATVKDSGALHLAIKGDHVDIVEFLLSQGAEVNSHYGWDSLTPLHSAVIAGSTNMVELMLENGADINAKGGFSGQAMPLSWAALAGDSDMVAFLINHDADRNTYTLVDDANDLLSAFSTSVLFNAILSKDPTTINLVLDAGVDANLKLTPAHIAAITGDIEGLRSIAAAEGDLNVADALGIKPIHYATGMGNVDVIKALVSLGVDPNTPISTTIQNGLELTSSPLHIAVELAEYSSTKALLSLGVSANVSDPQGLTPLHLLGDGREPDQGKIAELLISYGADVNAVDKQGNTPLHSMVDQHNVDVFKVLLAHGANPNLKNQDGFTVSDLLDHKVAFGGPTQAMEDCFEMKDLLAHHHPVDANSSEKLSISDVLTTSHSDHIAGLEEHAPNLIHTQHMQQDFIHTETLLINPLSQPLLQPQVVEHG